MLQDIDLSKINTPFDIIKLKNDFICNSSKNYLKEVFEMSDFKIKEVYRLYVIYDKELSDNVNFKVDQELLSKTASVNSVYDISAIVLEDYNFSVQEWNVIFEELNTDFNLNDLTGSTDKLLKKINDENVKNHPNEIYVEVANKYFLSLLNYCKNEMHVNTFMTRRIKSKFFDLDSLSTPTIELLEEVINRETLRQFDFMDDFASIHSTESHLIGNKIKIDYVDDLNIEPYDDSYLDNDEPFTSIYLDFSKTKSLDELLRGD